MRISKKRNQKINKRVEKVLADYIPSLQKKISVEGVFLFGSAARGQMKKESDIDLIVLSKDFAKMNFLKRLVLLSKAREKSATKEAMDIVGYTPKEFAQFDKSDSVMLRKIKEEGFFV